MPKPIVYYTTARLAKELGMNRTAVCKMLQRGKLLPPDVRLHGVGSQNPQAGFSLETIQRIKAKLKYKKRTRTYV